MKTVIYLDVLLLVNFLIAYFILLAAGLLGGMRGRFVRLIAGAVLSSLSALILFAPQLPYALQLVYKIATAGLITWVAFGGHEKRKWLAVTLWYAGLNILLAGFALLYIYHTASELVHTANMAVYIRVSPLLLVTLAALCSLLAGLILRLLAPVELPPPVLGMEVELADSNLRLRAVLDTGCHLKDPISCLPVLLISYPDARPRLTREIETFLEQWFTESRHMQPPSHTRLRMIPCTTANGRTLLPGFSVKSIGVIHKHGVQPLGPGVVAFSPQSLGGHSYEALYGADFLPAGNKIDQ